MADINIEDYIQKMVLSPELAEKARQCRSNSELLELAAENDVELPDDVLENVAGGNCSSEPAAVSTMTLARLIEIAKAHISELKALNDVRKILAKERFIEIATPILISENRSVPEAEVRSFVEKNALKAIDSVL